MAYIELTPSLGNLIALLAIDKCLNIVNEDILRAVSNYFCANNITFCNEDFALTLSKVTKGGFVDPDLPYDPVSQTAHFTQYNKGGFNRDEQIRLKECCDALNQRGVKFML